MDIGKPSACDGRQNTVALRNSASRSAGPKVDSRDRVYSSSFSGVKVYDRGGKLLGEIVAEGVANFCFGGRDNNMLFMMCDTAINIATIAATGV